jgi:predicted enzyme related to lactoylglutathione lyase
MGRVIHFEIPSGNPEKSVEFYRKVFGWKIESWGGQPYWLVSTGERGTPGIDGAIMPNTTYKTTVNTVDVPSVEDAVKKVVAAGGRKLTDTMPIPSIGYLAYCEDTDGVVFGVLQPDQAAK